MVTIGVDQLLSNIEMYENRCLENIKKLYKYASKWYDKQKYKAIIKISMISTPEGYANNSLISIGPYFTVKKLSARNSLYTFSHILGLKQISVVLKLGAAKSKHRDNITSSMLWSSITNRRRHTNINEQVNKLFMILFYRIHRLYNL